MISELKNTPFSSKDVCEFLSDVNLLFDPPLKDRINKRSDVKSFQYFVEKVLTKGFVLVQFNNVEIEGISLFYANDLKTFKSYITLVAVRSNYQGQGLGERIVKSTIDIIKYTGMKSINVKTWSGNFGAVALYEKLGFKIVNTINKDIILEMKLGDE